jgi:chemotaxis signal transduction protein
MEAAEAQGMVNHNGSANALRLLRCIVGEATYCLSMVHVRGIRRLEELQPNHHPSGPLGWLASASGPIPVFDLVMLLKQACTDARRRGKILLFKTHQHPWGVLVDRLESVIQVTAREVFPLPAVARNSAADFFEGVVRYNGTMLLALSPAGLHPDAPAGVTGSLPSVHTPESLYATVGVSPAAQARGKVMLFSAAPEQRFTFALSLSQVPQILRHLPLTPVPGAAPDVLGLVDWRNVPLAVLDLSRRLGGPAAPLLPDGRLLVARASHTRAFVGLAIRPQISLHNLPMAHRVSTRHVPLHASLLRGRFERENDLLLIPDIDRLLVTHDGAITPGNSRPGRDIHH